MRISRTERCWARFRMRVDVAEERRTEPVVEVLRGDRRLFDSTASVGEDVKCGKGTAAPYAAREAAEHAWSGAVSAVVAHARNAFTCPRRRRSSVEPHATSARKGRRDPWFHTASRQGGEDVPDHVALSRVGAHPARSHRSTPGAEELDEGRRREKRGEEHRRAARGTTSAPPPRVPRGCDRLVGQSSASSELRPRRCLRQVSGGRRYRHRDESATPLPAKQYSARPRRVRYAADGIPRVKNPMNQVAVAACSRRCALAGTQSKGGARTSFSARVHGTGRRGIRRSRYGGSARVHPGGTKPARASRVEPFARQGIWNERARLRSARRRSPETR